MLAAPFLYNTEQIKAQNKKSILKNGGVFIHEYFLKTRSVF